MPELLHILLVEDNRADAVMLMEVIGGSMDLSCRDDLTSALEHIREHHVDAVLLDLTLPDSQGLDTVAKFHENAPEVPIVVLTGSDDEPLAMDVLRSGAQDYLVKGHVDGKLLRRSLRYAIERRANQADRERLIEALRVAGQELEKRVQERTGELAVTVEDLQGEVRERIRAENELREAGELLERVFATTHVLFAYMDRDFNFIRVNRIYAEVGGHPPEFYTGRNHFELYPNPENETIFREVVQTGVPYMVFQKAFAYAQYSQRGVTFWDWSVIPVRDARGNVSGLVLSLLDVTARRQAEEAMRESEQRYRQLFESAPIGIGISTFDGHMLAMNESLKRLFGTDFDAQNVSIENFYANSQDRHEMLRVLQRDKRVHDWEARFKKPDGTVFPALLNVEQAKVGGKDVLLLIVRDITERRRLESEVLKASEAERLQIGHDLHDSLGQNLTGLAMMSMVLRQKLNSKGLPEALDAQQIEDISSSCVSLTRMLARGFSPVGIQSESLIAGLKELAMSAEEMFGVSCRVQYENPVIIEDHTASIHLYRIAQEAINNAVKHGKAKNIHIALLENSDTVTLSIKDDGVGFEKNKDAKPGRGMGMRIMRYRAGAIGASLDVSPAPDSGAAVTCVLRKLTN